MFRPMLDSAAAVIDELLADPPALHAEAAGDDGTREIWPTDRERYRFIAEYTCPALRTLETGAGLSTIVFAATGARHTCVTPDAADVDRIHRYCAAQRIDTSAVQFEIGCSDEVLPRLEHDTPLDLVLIDGNHGFPTPMLDWYYAAAHLRANGLLVLDDVALPAVAHLCTFIDCDPRFSLHRGAGTWRAYRKLIEGGLRQEWFEQPFYATPDAAPLAEIPGRVLRRVQKRLGARRRPTVVSRSNGRTR
jgi:predicted O-methyltransferase YrrM